jgi:hypothetical protein
MAYGDYQDSPYVKIKFILDEEQEDVGGVAVLYVRQIFPLTAPLARAIAGQVGSNTTVNHFPPVPMNYQASPIFKNYSYVLPPVTTLPLIYEKVKP